MARLVEHLNVPDPLDILSLPLLHLLLYCPVVVQSILHGSVRDEADLVELGRFYATGCQIVFGSIW